MTEQEAKICIQGKLDCMNKCDVFDCKGTDECDNCKYLYLQGTFGEQKQVFEMAIKALEEIQQYRAIGTPDECRAAVEKQKAKKIVRVKLRQSEWGSEYRCPVCESDLIKTVFFNEDGTEPDEKISWCSGCGQKIDWSDK